MTINEIVPPVVGAASGAVFGSLSTYLIQVKYANRLQRLAQFKQELYDFLKLVAKYWAAPRHSAVHGVYEAQILAEQDVIRANFEQLARLSRRLRRAHKQCSLYRIRLWDAASGGSFQSRHWKRDPERVAVAATAISQIIRSLPP